MKKIEISKTCSVDMYSSIKELPIALRKRFDYYLLQDSGIGSSMEDVDEHLTKAFTFIANDKREDAMEELKNMRMNVFSMLKEIDHRSLSMACLVATVNGEPVRDHSPEGLEAMLKRLSDEGLTVAMVDEILSDVKKNLIPSAGFTSLNILERMLTTLRSGANI